MFVFLLSLQQRQLLLHAVYDVFTTKLYGSTEETALYELRTDYYKGSAVARNVTQLGMETEAEQRYTGE